MRWGLVPCGCRSPGPPWVGGRVAPLPTLPGAGVPISGRLCAVYSHPGTCRRVCGISSGTQGEGSGRMIDSSSYIPWRGPMHSVCVVDTLAGESQPQGDTATPCCAARLCVEDPGTEGQPYCPCVPLEAWGQGATTLGGLQGR